MPSEKMPSEKIERRVDPKNPSANLIGRSGASDSIDGESTRSKRRSAKVVGLALLGVLVVVGMGTLGYLFTQSDGSTDTETITGSAAEAVQASNAGEVADPPAAEDTTGDAEGSVKANETAPTLPTDGEPDSDDDAAVGGATEASADARTGGGVDRTDDATDDGANTETAASERAATGASEDSIDNDSGRQAVLRSGKVYLSGAVPSEEVGEQIEQKAAAVVGPENVVNGYTVDPAAVINPGESAPVYVDDVVLFPFNSVEVDPAFLPILDLGAVLLRQNPQATISIISRTDAVGSEEVNRKVAEQRGQAVINYWLLQGVDRSQVDIDARGEEGATVGDDERTASESRRAEFVVTGLLD